jgi:hypothetical protein
MTLVKIRRKDESNQQGDTENSPLQSQSTSLSIGIPNQKEDTGESHQANGRRNQKTTKLDQFFSAFTMCLGLCKKPNTHQRRSLLISTL